MMNGTVHNSQGVKRIARTVPASCSSTPQLVSGGRRPRPSQLSAVSARIMPGMEGWRSR